MRKAWFIYAPAIVTAALMIGLSTTAQVFTTLHSFNGSDGADSWGSLVLCSNVLYGTTYEGGAYGHGNVFSIHTDGSGFSDLHDFNGDDGALPRGGLVLAGQTLYGTTIYGGPGTDGGPVGDYDGVLFSINTDGSGFTNFYNFSQEANDYQADTDTNGDGANPYGQLVLSGGTLYGTTANGGTNGYGTLFAINTNGTGFTVLRHLTADVGGVTCGMVISSNTLYGTSQGGALFSLSTNGADFTNFYNFTDDVVLNPLTLSGDTLYGTATFVTNEESSGGEVFSIQTGGSNFRVLHTFDSTSILIAGATPAGDAVYGAKAGLAFNSGGQIFVVNTNGIFTVLYNFSDLATNGQGGETNSDGDEPSASLILSGNTLYGVSVFGGTNGSGTVYSLGLPSPVLTLQISDGGAIATWPTNAFGFILQSAPDLTPPVAWTPVPATPIVENGQYEVTNLLAGEQMFFRLTQ